MTLPIPLTAFARGVPELTQLLDAAKLALDAAQKFVRKCDIGMAQSTETYAELKIVIDALNKAGVK